MTLVGNVNISPLLKAIEKFEKFRKNNNSEQEKAGTIQAFEYCFELSWKIMKRLLAEKGLEANSPKETFRMSALENFIDDPELWFDFLQKRNLTVHSYNPEQAEEVLKICELFSRELSKFIQKITKI